MTLATSRCLSNLCYLNAEQMKPLNYKKSGTISHTALLSYYWKRLPRVAFCFFFSIT